MTKAFIGYCRVSTQEQGESRNGLEGQRAEIERWAAYNGYELVEIFEEVASGGLGLHDRPVLSMALAMAKQMKAKVVVSKLDRASRDAGLIRELMHKTKRVVAIDLGEQSDNFVRHIFAGLAEKEREMISMRTKAGLAAAKARGVILGNRTNLEEARAEAVKVIKNKADSFAARLRAPIERMKNCGMTLAEIAKELNEQGTPTARGGNWDAASVCRLVARWK
jgi:DNA invertase Pin-like site-specific DNA recombinase